MKSILVDALRQANGDEGDKALSDSGSLDASSQEFAATANDEQVAADGELELMETTSSLEVPTEPGTDAAGEFESQHSAPTEQIDTSHAVTIVGELPRPVPPQKAPAIARYAPMICILLAIAVSACWYIFQEFGVASSTVGFDRLASQARPAHTPGIPDADSSAPVAPNFPFLEIEQPRYSAGARR